MLKAFPVNPFHPGRASLQFGYDERSALKETFSDYGEHLCPILAKVGPEGK